MLANVKPGASDEASHRRVRCDLRVNPSAEERARGFAWAEQFDFRRELPLLTNLW